jgi:hypothetical protein
MEIRPNRNVEYIPHAGSKQGARPVANYGAEGLSFFGKAQALESKLASEVEVRAEVVEKGRALVSQSEYPPTETINKIAALLAANLIAGKVENAE